jgi:hypothetical protein
MKSTLPATHLLRHFVLFALTIIFLLTMIRAAYGLWQFPKVMEADALVDIFIMGVRFDLALIGYILLIPVVLGSLLGMFDSTRLLAKWLVPGWLIAGLLFILLAELVTPYFVAEQGLRPDIPLLSAVEKPLAALKTVWSEHLIPAVIGVVLAVLILIAFWSRLETSRLLRYRLSRLSAMLLAIVGGAGCLLAIWSGVDPRQPALSPGSGLISADATVNDIASNTAFKTLYSIALPYLNESQ